jgi:hypothetical protein
MSAGFESRAVSLIIVICVISQVLDINIGI